MSNASYAFWPIEKIISVTEEEDAIRF